MTRKPVILDHDGGHDDLVALALLLANPDKIKVIGCIVTDADCIIDDAFSVTGKLMSMMHLEESTELFPIGKSSFKGINPFPTSWRYDGKCMDDFPCMNICKNIELWRSLEAKNSEHVGEQLLADLVMNSEEKVTICVTGPLSCVAWCIEKYGEAFCRNVEECIIMGGAIDVRGNVFIDGRTDGSAEWNIFWDAPAAKTVLSCPHMRNVLFSLDSTNHVPVNSAVVQKFGAQNNYLLSQFVASSWAGCTHFAVQRPDDGYFAWDVLTAAYAIDPTVADLDPMPVNVTTEAGPSEGRTMRSSTAGPLVHVARNTKADLFYKMVYQSMRKALMK